MSTSCCSSSPSSSVCCKEGGLQPDMGILLLRLGLAAVFIVAGWGKLQNTQMVLGMFGGMGIPTFLSYIIMYGELIAGIAVLVGIGTRYAGLFLAIIMIFALILVKSAMGFTGGANFDVVLLCMSLALPLLGPGKFSLDAFLAARKSQKQSS